MPDIPTIQRTDAEQAERDDEERARTLEETLAAVHEVMDNSDGIARIEAITDEEWDAAQALDDADAAEAGDG